MTERNNYRNKLIGIICIFLLMISAYFLFRPLDLLQERDYKDTNKSYEKADKETKGFSNNMGFSDRYKQSLFFENKQDSEILKNEDIANRIFVSGRSSVFYVDPVGWIKTGYTPNISSREIILKAQTVNIHGYKIAGEFDYRIGNESGPMVALDPENFIYQKTFKLASGEHDYKVAYKGITVWGKLIIEPFKCDNCHMIPPKHTAYSSNWGRCNTCHNLGVKVHAHAVKKAKISPDNCLICHSQRQYENDIHEVRGLWCVDCHGSLKDSLTGQFRITGQAGKPKCGNCHDKKYNIAQNKMFGDSLGHGGILCINCHNAAHRIIKPINLGDAINNNCSGCHSTQPDRPKKGRNCGNCHKSGWDPHLIVKLSE